MPNDTTPTPSLRSEPALSTSTSLSTGLSKGQALPAFAEDFLRDVCATPATERSYQAALRCLQRFAEASGYAQPNTPLPPAALRHEFLGDFYSWLKDRKEPKYRNDTIRLYLAAARRYVRYLKGSNRLPKGLDLDAMGEALRNKTPSGALRPARRGSDPVIGVLLGYYEHLFHNPPVGEEYPRQQRLVLLRNHALLHTLYSTAGRAAEVAALQRADVAGGQATVVYVTGKGGKERPVVLTAEAQRAIRAYLRERSDTAPGLFISHGAHKEKTLSTKSIWRIANDAARAVFGVDEEGRQKKHVGPHAFRHLRAQDLSDEGMDLPVLQDYLGHASPVTTRQSYAPKTPSEKMLDQVATYGRQADEVIARGEQAIES